MPPIILENNCNGCGLCDLLCPVDIIFMEKKMAVVRYPDECWHCGTGYIKQKQMLRAGLLLNIIGIFIVFTTVSLFA